VLVLTDAQLEGLRTLQVRALAEKLHVLGCFGDKPDFSFTSRQSAWLRAALTAWMPPSVSPAITPSFESRGFGRAPPKKAPQTNSPFGVRKSGRERRTAATVSAKYLATW
jgi:hypothetical protein